MPSRFVTTDRSSATVAEVNDRLQALADALVSSQPELERLLAEQAQVDLQYRLRFAAFVTASEAGSEQQRKAEAETALSESYLDDSDEDLATRKAMLAMKVEALKLGQHNIRAQISAVQTIASNLRAEATVTGVRA